MRIAFLGSAYCGYQTQKNAPTVQQTLTVAAASLFGFPCDVTGCSRTDSGVHAKDFCVTVCKHGTTCIETTIPTERIPLAFATVLPADISVMSASWVPDSFHARYDVMYKEYEYLIWNAPTANPFYTDRCWHYPRLLDGNALIRMQQAAAYFVGKHDFASFMAAGSDVTDTVREVKHAFVERQDGFIVFRVAADGFLYNMVRIMTGTLIAVAEGKIEPSQIPSILSAADRSVAGMTAPAKGLYLNRVVYSM